MATKSNKSDSQDKTMTTAEAGKLGGDKVAAERGSEFYSEIGSQQGKENNPGNFANRPKEEVKEAGHRGGVSRGQNTDNKDLDEAS